MPSTFTQTDAVETHRIRDVILLPKQWVEDKNNKVIVLNDTAAHLWNLLINGFSVDTIMDEFHTFYEQEPLVVETDIHLFIDTLKSLQFLSETTLEQESRRRRTKTQITRYRPDNNDLPYRKPKMYLFDLDTEKEESFGPHIRGRSYAHRAIS